MPFTWGVLCGAGHVSGSGPYQPAAACRSTWHNLQQRCREWWLLNKRGIHIKGTWFISESQCISSLAHPYWRCFTSCVWQKMSQLHHLSSDMLSHFQSLSNKWLTWVTDWWTKHWNPFYRFYQKKTNCILKIIDGYWMQSNEMAPKAYSQVIFVKLQQNLSTDATIFFFFFFQKCNTFKHFNV